MPETALRMPLMVTVELNESVELADERHSVARNRLNRLAGLAVPVFIDSAETPALGVDADEIIQALSDRATERAALHGLFWQGLRDRTRYPKSSGTVWLRLTPASALPCKVQATVA